MSNIHLADVDERLVIASNWLRRWGLLGGSVHLRSDGSATFGWPVHDLSPAFSGVAVRPPEGGAEYLAAARSYGRQMSDMLDELQATPGGVQAVKDLLRGLHITCFTGWTVQ